MRCPYCGSPVVRVHSSVIYGRDVDYGFMRRCSNFPKCDAYAGRGATIANARLRELRKRCHRIFDQRWKSGRWTRGACYHWLQKVMGMTASQAHIAQFREADCEKLLCIIDPVWKKINDFSGPMI